MVKLLPNSVMQILIPPSLKPNVSPVLTRAWISPVYVTSLVHLFRELQISQPGLVAFPSSQFASPYPETKQNKTKTKGT